MPDWAELERRFQRGTAGGVAPQGVASPPSGGSVWDRAEAQSGRRTSFEAVTPEEFNWTEPTPRPEDTGLGYTPPEEEGISAKQVGLGGALAGAGLLAAGMIRKNPHLTMKGLRGLGRAVNTARYTSMLSGLAPVKSALGNIGAPLIESAERGILDPAKAFVSRQTISDWLAAIRDPRITSQMQGLSEDLYGGMSRFNLPGRVMGAGDYATQQALIRGGLTMDEAQRATLMTPLTKGRFGKVGEVLDSPAAEVMIPFRRVPFNQALEGGLAIKKTFEDPLSRTGRLTMGASVVGGAAGAATADEQYPVLPAFIAAMAGRYGLPVGLAAALVRLQMGKGGGGIPGSLLPVSEYGFEESLKNPLRPLDPDYWGIRRAIRRATESR